MKYGKYHCKYSYFGCCSIFMGTLFLSSFINQHAFLVCLIIMFGFTFNFIVWHLIKCVKFLCSLSPVLYKRCCHWKQYSDSKAWCRGRTSWSQTTQGNGIFINESCDIAPLFYTYSPKDQRIYQTEYIVTTLFSICTSLQKLGSDRFLWKHVATIN